MDQLTAIVRGLAASNLSQQNTDDPADLQPPAPLANVELAALRMLQDYGDQVVGVRLDATALERVIRHRPLGLSVWLSGALLLLCGGQLELWQKLVHTSGPAAGQVGGPGYLLARLASGPANLRAGEFVEWMLGEELPQGGMNNQWELIIMPTSQMRTALINYSIQCTHLQLL